MIVDSLAFGWTGPLLAAGVAAIIAESCFRKGRYTYQNGFWLCSGNLVLSALVVLAQPDGFPRGWPEPVFYLAVTWIAYFAYLGASDAFRVPKNVQCFRCDYVSYPSETDAERTQYDEDERQAFQRLNAVWQRDSNAER